MKGQVCIQVGHAADSSLHDGFGSGWMQSVASDDWQTEADCTERVPLLFV